MKVLLLHTLPPLLAAAGRIPGEFDLHEAASAIAAVLPGSAIAGVHGDPGEVMDLLAKHRPDVVFNLCEAPQGRPSLEPHLAALLEMLSIRFTGCGGETLWLCRRKDLTNAVLDAAGVAIPAKTDLANPRFPCIVKPSDDDGSAGIDGDSVCEDQAALERALSKISGKALVQDFLPGREFAVSLWGQHNPDHHSIGETVFRNGLRLVTYSAKWRVDSGEFADSPMYYDSEIEPALRAAIAATAQGAWSAVGARHLLRVDVRLDRNGRPCVLDVNPNPEIAPEVGISRAVRESGWAWPDFIHKLVEWA